MARPVAANSQVTHDRILAAAHALFTGGDAARVSLRDIARLAGVSVGTLQHYFGSRAELYQACIDCFYMRLQRLSVELFEQAERAADITDTVEFATREGFRFACRERGALRMWMSDVARKGQVDEQTYRHEALPLIERAARVLAQELTIDVEEICLTLQSIVYLIARFAITDPRQLTLLTERFFALSGEQAAQRKVEDFLCTLAIKSLGLTSGRVGQARREQMHSAS
ncbi:MAG: TetR/AcrR family transcriptional regulator [Deltaproteobacteria bacterium]|nr:TetR/AcrR family transcriptional regulator [Deltaproteobacteria bacterium]